MKSVLHRLFRTSSAAKRPAILAAAVCVNGACRLRPVLTPARVFRTLLFFLLLLVPIPNPANSRGIRVPFRTVESMILIEGKIDEKRITFLLDTGSNHTIVSVRFYGNVLLALRPAQHDHGAAGWMGESVRLPVELSLADHIWAGQCVTMMNLDELQKALGIHFDGLLGQDILREFRSVRIDYSSHIIELEQ
jgi:hypothetical protein